MDVNFSNNKVKDICDSRSKACCKLSKLKHNIIQITTMCEHRMFADISAINGSSDV